MALLITAPPSLKGLRKYICNILVADFLGIRYHWVWSNVRNVTIAYPGSSAKISMPDVFFANAEQAWGGSGSLPRQPICYWDTRELPVHPKLVNPLLPCIYGDDNPKGDYQEDTLYLPIDMFGTAFFMLSRYEEWVVAVNDEHERFPAKASLAFKEGFLDRPIVDEYVELLWAAIAYLWPGVERKNRQPKTIVTCDVDRPYYPYVKSKQQTLKVMTGDIIKRYSVRLARERWLNYQNVKKGSYKNDAYWRNLYWIMDANEKAGTELAYYLIPEQLDPEHDGCYLLSEPVIREFVKTIVSRGHEIGLHASYCSLNDYAQLSRELHLLEDYLKQQGIEQPIKGGRQHYLRWNVLSSPVHWDNTNMLYDSTLGFADAAGFRCGTSQEYPMFDLQNMRELKIRQRPLILMESSVISAEYMGLGYTDRALEYMQMLKQRCYKFGGVFTLLWHNSHLSNAFDKFFYQKMIT